MALETKDFRDWYGGSRQELETSASANWNFEEKALKDLKKGEWFTLKKVVYPTDGQVYTKDEYDRSSKKYICIRHNDVWGNGRELKGTTKVYTNFIY